MKKIEAIIFNMDGIIFNTPKLWIDSLIYTNHIYGYKVPLDVLINSLGQNKNEIINILKETISPKFNALKYLKRSTKYFSKYIKNSLIIKDGLFALIDYAKNNNISLALISQNSYKNIKKLLRISKIPLKDFNVILTPDNKSKTNIYLECCTKLNVNPKNTYVLESTNYGLETAKKAKTIPLLIPDFPTLDRKTLNKAYKVLNNLNEVIPLLENKNS